MKHIRVRPLHLKFDPPQGNFSGVKVLKGNRKTTSPAHRAARVQRVTFGSVAKFGQTHQTVNLAALPSEVQILPGPPHSSECRFSSVEWANIRHSKFGTRHWFCGSSSAGRASPFQGESRGFESRLPLRSVSDCDFRRASPLCTSKLGIRH